MLQQLSGAAMNTHKIWLQDITFDIHTIPELVEDDLERYNAAIVICFIARR